MKKLVIVLALLAPMASQAMSVTVKGERAAALIRIGEKLELADHAMGGRVDLDLQNIVCRKIVDDVKGLATCLIGSAMNGQSKDIALSTEIETQNDIANDLRVLLRELTWAEKKVSATEKQLQVKSVSCHGAGRNHVFDDLEIEESYSCTIKIK